MPIVYIVNNTDSKIIFITSTSFCKGQKSVSSYPATKNKYISAVWKEKKDTNNMP